MIELEDEMLRFSQNAMTNWHTTIEIKSKENTQTEEIKIRLGKGK